MEFEFKHYLVACGDIDPTDNLIKTNTVFKDKSKQAVRYYLVKTEVGSFKINPSAFEAWKSTALKNNPNISVKNWNL